MRSRAVSSSTALSTIAAALVACTVAPPPPALAPLEEAPPPSTASRPSRPECPADDPETPPSKPEQHETRTLPDRPIVFGRITCKAGAEVWRDPEGRLTACTMARRTPLGPIEIAADAYSLFHAGGSPWQTYLARAHRLRTAAGMTIPCAADFVVLSESGALEYCKLNEPLAIGDVACRAGERIAFHAGGQLAGAVLDRPLQALGTALPAGARLSWREDGTIAGAWVPDPLQVRGYRVRYEFKVHPNGTLAEIQLAEPHTIQGNDLPQGSKVSLRKDGTLRRAEYVSRHGTMPHGEPWTDTLHLRFDCSGKRVDSDIEHWQADTAPPRLP